MNKLPNTKQLDMIIEQVFVSKSPEKYKPKKQLLYAIKNTNKYSSNYKIKIKKASPLTATHP